MKKLLTGLLLIVLASTLLPPVSALALNQVDFSVVGVNKYLPGEEIVELRDQYSETVSTGGGNVSKRIYLGSINYYTEDGYVPIQTDILPSSKSYWDWEVETGHWRLYIKNDTTVQIVKGDNWVGQRLHGIAYLDVSTKNYEIIQTVNNPMPPTVNGSTLTWVDILYGVDLVVRYTNDSFKEDIVIKQIARDLLNSPGYRPADYGLNTATTYLVPIFEMDWNNALPMQLGDGTAVNPDEAEHEETIYFESSVADPYFNTNLVSFMPLDYAVSENPVNPQDPEDEWEYASAKIRKRLITKNGKHWLLLGVPVVTLNQMPEGNIIFDPTETLRPNATGDLTELTPDLAPNWSRVDEASPDDNSSKVYSTIVATFEVDLYNLPASSGSGTINFIKVYFRCKPDTSGNSSPNRAGFQAAIKSNSTVTYSSPQIWQDASWITQSYQWNTNPADSNAWEWADIDSLQIGVRIWSKVIGSPGKVTQVYVEVDYTVIIDPPTVTTQAVTDIEDTTATGNGNITDTGGEDASAWGIVWNTAGNPDTGDNVAAGSGSGGVGAFTASLTSLPTGTTVHTKAYATNSDSTSYGSEEDFLTKPAAPTNVAATDGTDETKVVITWTKSTGATDYHVWRGGVDLGAAGDVATFDDSGATAGTITSAGTVTASDGTSATHVVLSLAGETTGTTSHTYKVVASNATGDSDDSATDTGYRGVGALTYQWRRSAADSDASYSNIGGATTDPYNDTGAPAGTISSAGTVTASDGTETAHVVLSLAGEATTDGTGRYYQAVLSASGASNSPQTSDNNRGYRTVGTITYQWQRSAADSDAGYSNIIGATTDPYNDTAAPAGVITPGTATASDGTSTAHVVLSLAGESVADGEGRYFQAVVMATGASNSPQTSDNNRGYRTTGSITYQWQRSAADSDAAFGNIGGATTDPYNDTGAPANGDGRWYLVLLDATGTSQAESTHDRGFRGVPATITTLAATGFDSHWGIVNAFIDDEGTAIASIVGFDYGETGAMTSSWTETVDHGTGENFWALLEDLSAGTQYFFRAKVYNGSWGYGEILLFSTLGSDTLYEYLNTGGDGDSDDIYENLWTAMQFDADAIGHTITSVRVPLKRTLLPWDITLSIFHATAGNEPTGLPLTSATLDGDVMSTGSYTWYDFDVDDIILEGGASYALVVTAPGGNATNYIEWQKDTGGGLADAVASHSTDSGITWIDDAPIDMLFEIWGEPSIDLLDANVFTGYRETGDWIIVLDYENMYVPYYPDQDPESFFVIQLLDDTVVVAQVTCPDWGRRPGSIYLSAAQAATLEWGASDYKVRLYGTFTGNPTADYALLDADWRGAELTFLDKWVILTAGEIAIVDDEEMTVSVSGVGELLNNRGSVIFLAGIPYLDTVRPNLFEIGRRDPAPDDKVHTLLVTDFETRIGTELYDVLEDWSGFFGTDDAEGIMGMLLMMAFAVILIGGAFFGGAGIVIGFCTGYLLLLWGTWIGAVDWAILGIVTFVGALIFFWTKMASK